MSIKPVRLVMSEAVVDTRPFGDGADPFPDALTLAGLDFITCKFDGAVITGPRTEVIETDCVIAVVVTDPGTAHAHIRDCHPEWWQELCDLRRKMNANPFIGGMPRKVDGTFLMAGEDVGDG